MFDGNQANLSTQIFGQPVTLKKICESRFLTVGYFEEVASVEVVGETSANTRQFGVSLVRNLALWQMPSSRKLFELKFCGVNEDTTERSCCIFGNVYFSFKGGIFGTEKFTNKNDLDNLVEAKTYRRNFITKVSAKKVNA